MARKKRLTPALVKKIVEGLSKGMTVVAVCQLVGISRTIYYDWLKKGREGNGDIYEKFLVAIERANAEAEAAMLAVIRSHTVKNWQAAAWILERRFRDRWGRDNTGDRDDNEDNNDIDEKFL